MKTFKSLFTSLIVLVLLGCGGSTHIVFSSAPTTYEQTIQTALTLLSQYWKMKLERLPGGFVMPPVYSYDSPNDLDCDGNPVEIGNASFCTNSHVGQYIGFDDVYMRQKYQQFGPIWIYLVFAHETGHVVQFRVHQQSQDTRTRELQADCMAGAFISEMVYTGQLFVSQNDLDEVHMIFYTVGDDGPGRAAPAHPEDGHGTGAMRYGSFVTGYNEYVRGCHLNGVS